MVYGIAAKLDELENRIRTLENDVESCQLREKQIIVMFKLIMEKSKGKKVGMKEIIDWMEKTVSGNLTQSEINQPADLLSELVKKGLNGKLE